MDFNMFSKLQTGKPMFNMAVQFALIKFTVATHTKTIQETHYRGSDVQLPAKNLSKKNDRSIICFVSNVLPVQNGPLVSRRHANFADISSVLSPVEHIKNVILASLTTTRHGSRFFPR